MKCKGPPSEILIRWHSFSLAWECEHLIWIFLAGYPCRERHQRPRQRLAAAAPLRRPQRPSLRSRGFRAPMAHGEPTIVNKLALRCLLTPAFICGTEPWQVRIESSPPPDGGGDARLQFTPQVEKPHNFCDQFTEVGQLSSWSQLRRLLWYRRGGIDLN